MTTPTPSTVDAAMTVPVGTATEVVANRRASAVGSVQRHYHLDPPLTVNGWSHRGVVVVPGANATYAFTAADDGNIDNFTALVTHPREDNGQASVLAALGYLLTPQSTP